MRKSFVLVGVLSLSLAYGTSARADENVTVQTEEARLDAEGANDASRVDALSKQFKVTPEQVQQMRSSGKGWGGVTIQLSMAEQLLKQDPNTYPTMSDALAKIDGMRAEGQGWGSIAKSLGFKLGPVISAARHARRDMRAEMRAEKMNKGSEMRADRPAKMEKPMKPEHAGRPDHAGRPEHAPKVK
jgi:hypothetical protein